MDSQLAKKGQTQNVVYSVGIALVALLIFTFTGTKQGLLFVLGGTLGFVLYQASFGFTAGFSNVIKENNTQKMRAQMLMLIAASLLMMPLLAQGELMGHALAGKITPISVAMATGGFIFGIGMQMGGGCASGTLYHLGSGSLRMGITLSTFILGSLVGTFHTPWWNTLPSLGKFSMVQDWGLGTALAVNIGIAGTLWILFALYEKNKRGQMDHIVNLPTDPKPGFLANKWPLIAGALLLAALNMATLMVKGTPWGITSGFALLGAKVVTFAGVDLSSFEYWQKASNADSLVAPLLKHSTSVMNLGLILGAFWTAKVSGKLTFSHKASGTLILRLLIGGFLLGYGARLSSGCNIGAYFSGISSGSLHGWIWLVVAFVGNLVGYRIKNTVFLEKAT